MADLTIGEIKTLQLNLVNVDTTQNPPVQSPLDLTNATQVKLSWVIVDPNEKPKPPSKNVNMSVTNAPGGIVQYGFVLGDLVKPPDMKKDGVFRYSVQVTFSTGVILVSAFDGKLTIKDDSIL